MEHLQIEDGYCIQGQGKVIVIHLVNVYQDSPSNSKIFKNRLNLTIPDETTHTIYYEYMHLGGTQIWVGQGCAARASKPIPIFKGDFGHKGYPFLRIFLQK